MNVANKLTVFRVVLVPVFLFALYSPLFGDSNRIIAAVIFLAASLTDLIDGKLARRLNLITNFGKFMDPLADKLLVSAALIALVELGDIGAWVVIIIISREFIVTGLRCIAAEQHIVIAAGFSGKIKTFLQMTAVVFFLLGLQRVNAALTAAGYALLIVTVISTVYSGCEYVVKHLSLFKGEI